MDKIDVRGYKLLNPDWTSTLNSRARQYTGVGCYVEEGQPVLYQSGIHFCTRLLTAFRRWHFIPTGHIVEVRAYGDTLMYDGLGSTNKLEILRELSWAEVQEQVRKELVEEAECRVQELTGETQYDAVLSKQVGLSDLVGALEIRNREALKVKARNSKVVAISGLKRAGG